MSVSGSSWICVSFSDTGIFSSHWPIYFNNFNETCFESIFDQALLNLGKSKIVMIYICNTPFPMGHKVSVPNMIKCFYRSPYHNRYDVLCIHIHAFCVVPPYFALHVGLVDYIWTPVSILKKLKTVFPNASKISLHSIQWKLASKTYQQLCAKLNVQSLLLKNGPTNVDMLSLVCMFITSFRFSLKSRWYICLMQNYLCSTSYYSLYGLKCRRKFCGCHLKDRESSKRLTVFIYRRRRSYSSKLYLTARCSQLGISLSSLQCTLRMAAPFSALSPPRDVWDTQWTKFYEAILRSRP